MNKEEVLKRGYAKTVEEWWFLVDDQWDNLVGIIARFTPKNLGKMRKAKEEKQCDSMLSILNEAWFKAPDSPLIHSIPGWGRLCDLCSDFPGYEESETEYD